MSNKTLVVIIFSLVMIFSFGNSNADATDEQKQQYDTERRMLAVHQKVELTTLQDTHKKELAQLKALHAQQKKQFAARWEKAGVLIDKDFELALEKKIEELEGEDVNPLDEEAIKGRIEEWQKEYEKKNDDGKIEDDLGVNLDKAKEAWRDKLEQLKNDK